MPQSFQIAAFLIHHTLSDQTYFTDTLYSGKAKDLRNQFHDVSQYVMQNNKVKIQYTLENETITSSKMILRKAGYEGAVYRGQSDKRLQEVYPVISLVLHWGKHKWKALHVEAFLLMMRTLTGDFRYEQMIEELTDKPQEKGNITMCGLCC